MRGKFFTSLEGIRGIAAIIVVLYHSHPLLGCQLIPGGYLAVDLFFMLSGFVIAHAYEDRLASGLTASEFFKARLIRLYPLYLAGLAIGFIKAAVAIRIGVSNMSVADVAAATMLGLVFLPSGVAAVMFPLNNPSWSLFYELAVNLGYAAAVPRRKALLLLTVLSGVALMAAIVIEGGVDVGPLISQILPGFARAIFSFTIGLGIYRLWKTDTLKAVPIWIVWILSIAALAAVLIGKPRWILDMASVFIIFPLLVVAGVIIDPPAKLRPLCRYLGGISYAIYALHYPLIDLAQGAEKFLGLPGYALAAALIVGLLIAAPWIDKCYDLPFRRYLARRKFQRDYGVAKTPLDP